MTQPSATRGVKEEALIAEIVHGAMVFACNEFRGKPEPWQNGNSHAENYARSVAMDVIERTRTATPSASVERVARAIALSDYADETLRWPADFGPHEREDYRTNARAAIAALAACEGPKRGLKIVPAKPVVLEDDSPLDGGEG